MKRLAVIGSGDLGQLIAHHAIHDKHYDVIGFFDDFETTGELKEGISVIGKVTDVVTLFEQGTFDCIMIGIGYKHITIRKSIYESLRGKVPFGTIIHSSSYVDSSSSIGEGVFILPGCTVDKHVELGGNVLLNTGTVVAHDTKIDAHCFLSPAVSVAGKVHIKECCVIGINSTVIDNRVIEPNIQIGGGAVVIEDLSISGLYVGVPAVLKKKFD